jgi:signal transduction histidine kinase
LEFDRPLLNNAGYVHLGLSETRVRAQIQDSSNRLMLLFISAFVLWGMFIFFTGRWLTEPVLRLTEGAKRINKGILDHKIEVASKEQLPGEKNVDKEYEYVKKSGEIFQCQEKTEYHGDVIYTSTTKIPVRDETGSVVRIITVMKDVTEQKRLEEELKDSYEELRLTYLKLTELFKVKENFISNMSHGLRTPLTSIMRYTELLLDENIPAEQKHKLEVYRNSQRLSRLIQGLLDTAVIESKNLALNIQTLPLYEMMQHISEDMKAVTEIKNIPVKIDIPEQLKVEGDRDKLMQLLVYRMISLIRYLTGSTSLILLKHRTGEEQDWVYGYQKT